MIQPPGVFLSYSHKDRVFAHRLARDLISGGVRVWIDEADMLVGDSLLSKLIATIDSVDYVAAVISKTSVSSQWVRRELEFAMTREIEKGKVIVLPLLIEDCMLPDVLIGRVYADFRSHAMYQRGLESILLRLGVITCATLLSDESQLTTVSRLSDLTLPEEFYLLCYEAGDANTSTWSQLTVLPSAVEFLVHAIAVAELVLAGRLRLNEQLTEANSSATWPMEKGAITITVIDVTPLGDPILDSTLACVSSLIRKHGCADLLRLAIGSTFNSLNDVVINQLFCQLVDKKLLTEHNERGLIFSRKTRSLLATSLQIDLRTKFAAAVTARDISDRLATLLLLIEQCGCKDRVFSKSIMESQRLAARERAMSNQFAKVILQMSSAALSRWYDSGPEMYAS